MSSERIETLCKWRNVYGMMATMGDVNAFERYVRDVADKNVLMRAEISALVSLSVQKGVFTQTEFAAQVEVESEHLCELMEKAFPGFRATPVGLEIDTHTARATMESWKRPNGTGR